MPLHEFICQSCGWTFEEVVLSANLLETVKCPVCTSSQVRKKDSPVVVKAAGGLNYNLGGSRLATLSTCSPGHV